MYGHLTGDEVLVHVAKVLQEYAQGNDIVARVGGDEFALLLLRPTLLQLQIEVERIWDSVQNLAYFPSAYRPPIPLRLSVGVAYYPEDTEVVSELMYMADRRAQKDKIARQIQGFSMLDALLTAVDNLDRYTRRHGEEVMRYSLQIAETLSLTDNEKKTREVGGLLHDVGKIGIPARILRAPGSLSPADFDIIKQHSTLGVTLVSTVPELTHTLDIVHYHHEAWDGSGYPTGLQGTTIPLLARVTAVADTFSALTSHRPYRRRFSTGEAFAVLRQGAGRQWDADCVAAFEHAFHNRFPR